MTTVDRNRAVVLSVLPTNWRSAPKRERVGEALPEAAATRLPVRSVPAASAGKVRSLLGGALVLALPKVAQAQETFFLITLWAGASHNETGSLPPRDPAHEAQQSFQAAVLCGAAGIGVAAVAVGACAYFACRRRRAVVAVDPEAPVASQAQVVSLQREGPTSLA